MEKKDIVKYFYETVVSENLLDEVPHYVSEDCVVKSGETLLPVGVSGMKQHLAEVKKTYPDYTMKIIKQYTDGDYVISEFKRLSFTGVDIDKVIDGKIVEHGGAVNTFDTLYEHHLIKPV